jgi:hypothetical protein
LFCGSNDCDESGVVRYVRVQYSGREISPANELNSFTMNALGSGTRVEYCQAHMGLDDSFEWFGGKTHAHHLVATMTRDDGLDWQMGFRGSVQFAVVQADTVQGDRGIEADNNEFDFDAPCRSMPYMANLTLVGTGATGPGSRDEGIELRRGTDAWIFNSIVQGWDNGIRTSDEASTCARGVIRNIERLKCWYTSVDKPRATGTDLAVRIYPNPVAERTHFAFRMAQSGNARLSVFDVTGRLVDTVVDGSLPAGSHEVAWSPSSDLASGTYFYRFESQGEPVMGRITVVR